MRKQLISFAQVIKFLQNIIFAKLPAVESFVPPILFATDATPIGHRRCPFSGLALTLVFPRFYWAPINQNLATYPLKQWSGTDGLRARCGSFDDGIWLAWYFLKTIVTNETFSVIFHPPYYRAINNTMQHQKSH